MAVRALAAREECHLREGQIRAERDGPRCVMLQLTEDFCREITEVRKITLLDVDTFNKSGEFQHSIECQLQWKTQANWECQT